MKKSVLKKYAKLIAKSGAAVKKGQEVIIRADLDQPEFIAMLVEECYKLGAKDVVVDWSYQPISKINATYRSLETLSTIHEWELAKLKRRGEVLPAMIYISSEDPDGMNGVDREKLAKANQARYPILKPYLDGMDGKYQWCIAAVPGVAWAKKVFPELSTSKAVEALWNAILVGSRADKDPIAAWKEHNADIESRFNYLNSLGLRKLVYKSSNGTDFEVGLIPDGVFAGGGSTTNVKKRVFFNANIPSEEVFTSPMKGEAEGIVYATLPLSYQGQLIENFYLRFEKGKVVEAHAEKGEEILNKMLSMDEGASYLGECALVSFDSPINRTGILFYNTLFDENARCHLALGAGFSECIRGYENLTLDQCREKGINDSMIHVDFMIGSEDLSITGYTENGKEIPIFVNGTWAF